MKPLFSSAESGPGQTFDPRVKIAWLVIGAGMVAWQQKIPQLCVTLALVILLNYRGGLTLGRLRPLLKITALIGLQLLILQGFLQPRGTMLFTVGGFPFFSGGLVLGLRGILVVSCLALLFFQFLFWTSAREIILFLLKMRVPFKYAFMAGLAVRYLPLLQQDLRSIYRSQLSRGLRLDSYFKKIKGLPPIILPLILRTLRRVEAVSLSMELKGFGRYPQATQMGELKMGLKDLWAFTALAGYIVFLGWWF